MQTIGERLLDARQRRGVSIREAAEATKVRGDYLSAMESNQFDSIPLADVYRRGFLKIYARFLRLDSERITADFNSLLAARNPAPLRTRRGVDHIEPVHSIEPREPEAPDGFASEAIEIARRPENHIRTLVLGFGALAGLVFLGLVVKSFFSASPESATAATPPVAEVSTRGEILFIIDGPKPVAVMVKRKNPVAVVFEKTIPGGSNATFEGEGEFTVSAAVPIKFRVNGGPVQEFVSGYFAATVMVGPKGR